MKASSKYWFTVEVAMEGRSRDEAAKRLTSMLSVVTPAYGAIDAPEGSSSQRGDAREDEGGRRRADS